MPGFARCNVSLFRFNRDPPASIKVAKELRNAFHVVITAHIESASSAYPSNP